MMIALTETTNKLADSLENCVTILPKVSRTFAISILHLRGSLRNAVITSYLLCRIADTIEDDPSTSTKKRSKMFDLLLNCLEKNHSIQPFKDLSISTINGDKAHLELLRMADDVMVVYRSLDPQIRQVINRWVGEMIRGMKKFIVRYPNGIHVQTLEEYKEYCYYVAGTVGHLLTDLWKLYSPKINDQTYKVLDRLSNAFGEGLQTVNILKDIAVDREEGKRCFSP